MLYKAGILDEYLQPFNYKNCEVLKNKCWFQDVIKNVNQNNELTLDYNSKRKVYIKVSTVIYYIWYYIPI